MSGKATVFQYKRSGKWRQLQTFGHNHWQCKSSPGAQWLAEQHGTCDMSRLWGPVRRIRGRDTYGTQSRTDDREIGYKHANPD